MPDPRLDDLLDRYQELLDEGHPPDLDVLCRDCPELRPEVDRQIARLRRLGALLGDAVVEPAPLSLSDDKTWVSGSAAPDTLVEIPAPPGYEVLAPLGEGGMGIVYKARQVGLNRTVALKMILAGTRARAVDLDRFRAEAQAIAALRHPNIVQIYEVGDYRGRPFFSLEFCAGGTLAKALHGEPQPPGAAAAMVEVLARAIQSAHEKGIVHRDLKPGNVLLSVEPAGKGSGTTTMVGDTGSESWLYAALRSPEAAFKITDFGLAKRVDDDSGKTLDGSVMGTPSYMAPEQARGDLKAIGSAADVWALGAVLYELLTGRPPFKGATVLETLEQVRSRDPVPVHQLQPKVPRDLETVCLKCLEKDPARRYREAAALADDLRLFLAGKPILARPVGLGTRAVRWCRREPRTAGLVTALVLFAAAVPALFVGYGTRLANAEQLIEKERQARWAADRAERAAREVAEAHRYYAAISDAGRLRARPRPGWTWQAAERALEAADTQTPERDNTVVRTELAAALGSLDARPMAPVAPGVKPAVLAFATDGRLAAAPALVNRVALNKFVAVVDPRTGTETKLEFDLPPKLIWVDVATALAFSPDGRWLFLGMRSGTAYRWDLSQNPPALTRWPAHRAEFAGIVFSPDSKWVYTAGYDGQVKRWPIDGTPDHPAAVWPPKPAESINRNPSGIAYWPVGRPGVLTFGPGGSTLHDPQSLEPLGPADDWQPPTIKGVYGQMAAHPPSGTVVVAHGSRLDVHYWERSICRPTSELHDPAVESGTAHAGHVHGIAMHPGGWLVATVSKDEGLAKVWDLAAGSLALTLPAPGGLAVAFSADGSRLAVGGDHKTVVYELGGLREQTRIGRRGFPIRAIGRTADGRLATIAAVRDGNRLATVGSVWPTDGGPPETVFHQPDESAVTGEFKIAAVPGGGRTAFHAGDDRLVWRGPGAPEPTPLRRPGTDFFDLCLDPAGRVWMPAGPGRLTVQTPGSSEKPRDVIVGWGLGTANREQVCVRAAGDLVVTGSEHGYLRVVPAAGGKARDCPCFEENGTLFIERANTVWAVDVTEDTTRAIAGTEDGRLWLRALPDGTATADWPAHTGRVSAVAFDRTGDWLASGGQDGAVHLWQRLGLGYRRYLSFELPRSVRQVAFSDDGTALYVLVEGESAVREWHLTELHKRFRETGLDPQ